MAEYTLTEIIGNNIIKYRNLAGLTQLQLAEMVGISAAFLSRVECGKKMMKVSTLYSTAQALNVSCDALLHQEESTCQIENIRHLISNQPTEYLKGIEKLVQVCTEEFYPKGYTPLD